jgi:hypothetical protein
MRSIYTKEQFQRIATMSSMALGLELVRLEANPATRTSFYRECVGRELDARFNFPPQASVLLVD